MNIYIYVHNAKTELVVVTYLTSTTVDQSVTNSRFACYERVKTMMVI